MQKIKTDTDIKNAAQEVRQKYRELIIKEANKNAKRNTTRKGN